MYRFLLPLLLLNGCSTLSSRDVALDSDYARARFEFQQGHFKAARALLPAKEPDGFITTLESQWLGLIGGSGNAEVLMKRGASLEDLQTLRVSKEVLSTFYKSQENTYYPAEHEAVVHHLVTAMILLREKKIESARVELRRAARYLQGQYAPNRQDFDDPGLRLWLAALWIAAGDWSAAQVDLRVAARLAPGDASLQNLSRLTQPPARLILVMSGSGPSLSWQPLKEESPYPFAGIRFEPGRQMAPVTLIGPKERITIAQGFSTESWYRYHQLKNQLLSDAIRGTSRTGDAAVAISGATANLALVGLVSGGILVGGVGAGIGIVFLLPDKVGATLGLALGGTSYLASSNLWAEGQRRSGLWLEKGLGQIESYRFVRFLPDVFYVYAAANQDGPPPQLLNQEGTRKLSPYLALRNKELRSELLFYLDPQRSQTPTATRTVIRHYFDGLHSWFLYDRAVTKERAQALCKEVNGNVPTRLPGKETVKDLLAALKKVELLFPAEAIQELKARQGFWTSDESKSALVRSDSEKANLLCGTLGPVLDAEDPIFDILRWN